LRTILV